MAIQYSIQKMVSNGTLSTIALGIQYLQRNDIYVRIAGVETPQSGAPSGYTWSFINNTTLKILPVVPNGVEVVVYRRTDVDAMYNIYSQNAQFDEATIDENNKQLLYIAQEYLEQGLPGTGIESLQYVNTVLGINYYRFKLTDGSYTTTFGVPDGTAVLRTELKATDGASLIGGATYAQIRAYNGLANTLLCIGKSGADTASYGMFYKDPADSTTPDDDGCVLVGVGGVRWKRVFSGGRPAGAYGVAQSNVNNSAALQAAVSVGGGLSIQDGVFSFDTTIVTDYSSLSFPAVTLPSKRIDILGTSMGNTILAYAGNTFAFDMRGMGTTLAQGLHSSDMFGRMTLVKGNRDKTAVGLIVRSKAHFKIADLNSSYFGTGLWLEGCLTGSVENTYLTDGTIGLRIERSAYSLPNALSFNNVYFKSNTLVGVIGTLGGGNYMNGGTCEGNGTMATPNAGGMIFSVDGSNGSAALNIDSYYFENNAGAADLYIDNISAERVTVVLTSCIFTRLNPTRYVTNNIVLANSGGGGITLITKGCTFESKGGYVPSAARPFVYVGAGCEWINIGSTFSETTSLGTTGGNYPTASGKVTGGRVSAAGASIMSTMGIGVSKTGVGVYNITCALGRTFGKDASSYIANAVAVGAMGSAIGVMVNPISSTQITVNTFNTTTGAGIDTDFVWSVTTLA